MVYYRSIFDVVRDFLHSEAMNQDDTVLADYLKPTSAEHRRDGDEAASQTQR